MAAIIIFLELTNQNLLLGFVPESLGLLIFGIGLVALPVFLRGILSRVEKSNDDEQIDFKN